MKKAIIFLVAVALAGCAVGPDYKKPTVDVPQSFRFEDEEARDLSNTAWWEQFDDPVLSELIDIALQENKDVKVAAARIEAIRGAIHDHASGSLPANRGRSCRRNGAGHGGRVYIVPIRHQEPQ